MFFSLGLSSILDSSKKNKVREEPKLSKHEMFEINKLKKCIENGSEIEFTYRDEYFRMIPNSLTDRLDHYSLSAYHIDDDGKKKWRRFQSNLMKKI